MEGVADLTEAGPERPVSPIRAAVTIALVVLWLGVAIFLLWRTATDRPIPGSLVLGLVTLLAAALLASFPFTRPLLQESGETRIREFRARRAGGTRAAMDWQYHGRTYLLVPLGFFFALVGGIDLLAKPALWQKASGLAVLAATAASAMALLRWLRLPVDHESAARVREYQESMRWNVRGWFRRRRSGGDAADTGPG